MLRTIELVLKVAIYKIIDACIPDKVRSLNCRVYETFDTFTNGFSIDRSSELRVIDRPSLKINTANIAVPFQGYSGTNCPSKSVTQVAVNEFNMSPAKKSQDLKPPSCI